ncbi:LytR C-terminal domain-containing protein [Actinoplanes sp. NPDC051346]|uniref:LytR C-terminal domain-containing protein n=1 Tax=Actinoplanes sp. NPDC051346 TaxID=3155048 RepID=UPI00342A0DEA
MSFTRVRALILVGVLVVAAAVVVVLAVVRDSQGAAVAAGCPAGAPVANLRIPAGPHEVTVKVFNGTETPDLGFGVSDDFANRRFNVRKPAKNPKLVKDVAVLRYGPEGVGAAQLVQAYFLGKATPAYDPRRKGAVVDVVIGTYYRELGTTTQVNQAHGILGEADLPPGACAPTT